MEPHFRYVFSFLIYSPFTSTYQILGLFSLELLLSLHSLTPVVKSAVFPTTSEKSIKAVIKTRKNIVQFAAEQVTAHAEDEFSQSEHQNLSYTVDYSFINLLL